jgi:hypothetical protein
MSDVICLLKLPSVGPIVRNWKNGGRLGSGDVSNLCGYKVCEAHLKHSLK